NRYKSVRGPFGIQPVNGARQQLFSSAGLSSKQYGQIAERTEAYHTPKDRQHVWTCTDQAKTFHGRPQRFLFNLLAGALTQLLFTSSPQARRKPRVGAVQQFHRPSQ